MAVKTLEKFTFLRDKDLGDDIVIQQMGEDPETVELVRRGRQKIRVSRETEEASFLVDIDDVVVEPTVSSH